MKELIIELNWNMNVLKPNVYVFNIHRIAINQIKYIFKNRNVSLLLNTFILYFEYDYT